MTYRMIWTLKEKTQTTTYARAHLLSPKHMSMASQRLQLNIGEELSGNWLMCGVCSEALYQLANQTPEALMAGWSRFMDLQGRQFVVLSHQIGSAQHRLLLPMWDSRIPAITEALKSGRLTMVLQRPGTSQVLAIGVEPDRAFSDVLHQTHSLLDDNGRAEAANSLQSLLESMGEARCLPSFIEGQKVNEVSVSVVMEGFVPAAIAAEAMGVALGA